MGYNNQNVDRAFTNAEPKFVLVIVEPIAKRSLPVLFEVNTYVLSEEKHLYDKIIKPGVGHFKIYSVSKDACPTYECSMSIWKKKATEYFKKIAEEKERTDYERLHKKFGNNNAS